ncbi:hypothetical protein N7G274_001411 [Stereocaulon virgatum]|uniref:Uncharacterized protein n=1 Tax=Stereocaulon virgatum TaxID=373712 RepID=A0ABR4ANT0_9LECA
MPKKRAAAYATKPSSPAHTSLSPSEKPKDASHSLTSRAIPTSNSVNDRIQQLRLSQGSKNARASSDVLNPSANPTLPPLLRDILQLADAPPPRPRPGLRVTGRMRGPAGPVPPSWLNRRDNGTNSQARLRTPRHDTARAQRERLPGSFLPEEGSLIATTLKALAGNWPWHTRYDQYHLATIPIRYKEALLHYIAYYNAPGLDKAGLEVLFLDESELEDATGAEGLTHLDLATFIGISLNLGEVKELFSANKATASTTEKQDAIPESWDTLEFRFQPSSLSRFHSLTHLSLSHPSSTVKWKGLLDLAPHLMTLTHLSLAYWPTPTLSPNSTTAYTETPRGAVPYGARSYYSGFDGDWSEAAFLLRRLGKSTICLKWLDLTGCGYWVPALYHKQIDWFGGWQGLETVKVGQGWIPSCFGKDSDKRAWLQIYRQAPGYASVEERNRLREWVQLERRNLHTENMVNARIDHARKQAIGSGPEQLGEERVVGDSNNDWRHAAPDRSALGYRCSRVVFERDWDDEWIREAIVDLCERFCTAQ